MSTGDPTSPALPFTGERILPYLHPAEYEPIQYALMAHHRAVYQFIAQYCPGKSVLDIGSGTGHGTALLLRHNPTAVWGVDIAADAAAFATRYYPPLAGRLAVGDALHLPFAPQQFAVVCANDTNFKLCIWVEYFSRRICQNLKLHTGLNPLLCPYIYYYLALIENKSNFTT